MLVCRPRSEPVINLFSRLSLLGSSYLRTSEPQMPVARVSTMTCPSGTPWGSSRGISSRRSFPSLWRLRARFFWYLGSAILIPLRMNLGNGKRRVYGGCPWREINWKEPQSKALELKVPDKHNTECRQVQQLMWRNRPLYMMSTPHGGDAIEEGVEKNGRKSQAPNANSLGAESSGACIAASHFTLLRLTTRRSLPRAHSSGP